MMSDFAVSTTAAGACGAIVIAALVLDRRSPTHWALAAGFLLLGLAQVIAALGSDAAFLSDLLRWQRLRMLAESLVPATWVVFGLTFARANHRQALWNWRWFLGMAALIPLLSLTVFADSIFAIPPKWGEFVVSLIPLGRAGWVFHFTFVVVSVIALTHLEGTLRAATGSMRWKVKFMVLGLGSWIAVQVYQHSQTLLFSALDLSLQPIDSVAVVAAALLVLVALFRGRGIASEVYLSTSLLYNSIALLLIGIYLITVGALALEIDRLGGGDRFALVVFFVFLALIVLAMALLSDQLRLGLRRFVTRNFYRQRYDYRREWTAFTQRTASVVDVEELCDVVAKMVAQTLGISSVTLWLFDEANDRVALGGSTALPRREGAARQPLLESATEVVGSLRADIRIVDVVRDAESAEIERFCEDSDARYLVPLVATRQLVGMMTLNDRATGERLSLEDLDLVKTIADQAAGALLNLELSRRLLKAKQMEAFQTLSAFFTHDLKNLASTLSLTVQNLPANFENPEFRRDALRVISQSIDKMNTLCGRMTAVTKDLELQKGEIDLNELVTKTLADLDGSLRGTLVRELGSVRRVEADSQQLEKVLVNLVLNANDAVTEHGRIRVTTGERNGVAVLTVADDGCGMSEDFVARSLFQPFQTTKSQGLGIGLFQSRRIVEAHRGRIEVETEVGKGTTFRVELPIR